MLKLIMDGKPIGELDPNTGDLTTPAGKKISPPISEKAETIEVPAFTRRPADTNAEGLKDGETETGEETETDEVNLEDLPPHIQKFMLRQMERDEAFGSTVDEIRNMMAAQLQQTGQPRTEDDPFTDLDKINIPEDKDPYGIAKTMKGIVKALQAVNTKVTRVDQGLGYNEGRRALDAAKAAPGVKEVFEHKKLGPLAERLLTAELSTNRRDTLERIVARVAKEVQALSPDFTKEKLKKKVSAASTIPPVLRGDQGRTPAITINKPKTVSDASKAYAEWKQRSGAFK